MVVVWLTGIWLARHASYQSNRYPRILNRTYPGDEKFNAYKQQVRDDARPFRALSYH